MDNTLILTNNKTLCLLNSDNICINIQKPHWTSFDQIKRVGKNCNIIKEAYEDFTKFKNGKTNIYCLDDMFNLIWTLKLPSKNDSFPNPIVWDKATIRRQTEGKYLRLDVVDSPDTFICSSWNGITVTARYDTGKIITAEFTK